LQIKHCAILEDAIIRVEQSYVPIDFVVVDTGKDEKAPIILGRPFLCTTKAIIYAEHSKIVFTIKDNKEKFSFKNQMMHTPAQPYAPSKRNEPVTIKKKKKNPRSWTENKASQAQEETVKMINTIQSEYEGLLTPPFLAKKDDPGVPTIECLINQKVFHKTFCDSGSGVNIMSKVTYEYLLGNEPLYPTYMQLQMVDQSVWFSEGIAKDVIVQIQDRYVPTDFMVLDMGIEEEETLLFWEDRSSTLPTLSSTLDLDKSTFYFQKERYAVTLIVILIMNGPRRTTIGGDVNPAVKQTSP
jgi:hypothetical protein